MLCYEQVLIQKNGAHRSHSAMVSHSKSGARRVKKTFPGIESLKLVNRFGHLGSKIARTPPNLKVPNIGSGLITDVYFW